MPIFRRKMRETREYWEYFEVGGEQNLLYVDKDRSRLKEFVQEDETAKTRTTTENWEIVKGSEEALIRPRLERPAPPEDI